MRDYVYAVFTHCTNQSLPLRLLKLSDTDQAIVLRDKIGYETEIIEEETSNMYAGPELSDFEFENCVDDEDWEYEID